MHRYLVLAAEISNSSTTSNGCQRQLERVLAFGVRMNTKKSRISTRLQAEEEKKVTAAGIEPAP
jgi:hypothetical protein